MYISSSIPSKISLPSLRAKIVVLLNIFRFPCQRLFLCAFLLKTLNLVHLLIRHFSVTGWCWYRVCAMTPGVQSHWKGFSWGIDESGVRCQLAFSLCVKILNIYISSFYGNAKLHLKVHIYFWKEGEIRLTMEQAENCVDSRKIH